MKEVLFSTRPDESWPEIYQGFDQIQIVQIKGGAHLAYGLRGEQQQQVPNPLAGYNYHSRRDYRELAIWRQKRKEHNPTPQELRDDYDFLLTQLPALSEADMTLMGRWATDAVERNEMEIKTAGDFFSEEKSGEARKEAVNRIKSQVIDDFLLSVTEAEKINLPPDTKEKLLRLLDIRQALGMDVIPEKGRRQRAGQAIGRLLGRGRGLKAAAAGYLEDQMWQHPQTRQFLAKSLDRGRQLKRVSGEYVGGQLDRLRRQRAGEFLAGALAAAGAAKDKLTEVDWRAAAPGLGRRLEAIKNYEPDRRTKVAAGVGAAALAGAGLFAAGYFAHKTGHSPEVIHQHASATLDQLKHKLAMRNAKISDQSSIIGRQKETIAQLGGNLAHQARTLNHFHTQYYNPSPNASHVTGAGLTGNLHIVGRPGHEQLLDGHKVIVKKLDWDTRGLFDKHIREHLRKLNYRVSYGHLGKRFMSIVWKP